MKRIFITAILFFIACNNLAYAQQTDTSKPITSDTIRKQTDTATKRTATRIKKNIVGIKKDTIKNGITHIDSSLVITDTAKPLPATDTAKQAVHLLIKKQHAITDSMLAANRFINTKDKAVLFIASGKKFSGKEFVFYVLCLLALILGLFKTFYRSYFNNIFRVFFNTSIRQTQLTDQLLQAKLPSFILNIFFTISAGIFIWLLFKNYQAPKIFNTQWLLLFCIAGISIIYFIKFCVLKFMGWMSEMQQAANDYIFVIFLVNKIAGIVLVPFIILLAFAMPAWINYITTLSLLITVLFFLSRYIKTYSLLEYKFPLTPLHFVLYIAAIEVIPLLLIYKLVADYVV